MNCRERPGPCPVLSGAQLALRQVGQRQLWPSAQCHSLCSLLESFRSAKKPASPFPVPSPFSWFILCCKTCSGVIMRVATFVFPQQPLSPKSQDVLVPEEGRTRPWGVLCVCSGASHVLSRWTGDSRC